MNYKTLQNVMLIPAVQDFKGYGNFIHGVVCDDDSVDSEYITITRGGKSLLKKDLRQIYIDKNQSEIKKLSGRYLYLGAFPIHFGHLLAEGAHRLWISQLYKEKYDGLVILPEGAELNELQRNLLEYFNVDFSKINLIENLTKVEELVIPQPGSVIGEDPKYFYDEILRSYTCFKKISVKNKPNKIFVSRRNYKNVGRVAGFDYISSLLDKNEFKEFNPERFSFKEQLEYIKAADIIVWEEGSAIHLLDVLPKLKSKMILIRRRSDYGEFDGIIKNKALFFDIYNDVEFISSRKPPHNRMSRIKNKNSFFNFLKSNGIVFDRKDVELFSLEESEDIKLELSGGEKTNILNSREKNSPEDLYINSLRDDAIRRENEDSKMAYYLMKRAFELRPNGALIKKKLSDYEKKLMICGEGE